MPSCGSANETYRRTPGRITTGRNLGGPSGVQVGRAKYRSSGPQRQREDGYDPFGQDWRMIESLDESVRRWLSQITSDTEKRRAKEQAWREERAAAEAKAARERLTPLEDRLERLLATIPSKCSARGYRCRRFKLRDAADREPTVILANLARRCVGLGLSDAATEVALMGSAQLGVGLDNGVVAAWQITKKAEPYGQPRA
jgi:hypothetical protein